MAKNDTPSSEPSEPKARTNEELLHAAGEHAEGDAAIEAIEKNKNLIIGAILVGVIGFATVLILKQRANSAHLEAATAYSAAAGEGTIDALNSVAAEYEGSVAAGNALLMKSQMQIESGKTEDAQTTLQNFISKYPDHPRHQQGVFALGAILHNASDLEGARKSYEEALAVNEDSEIAPLIKIRVADTWLEAGDAEKARQLYESIPSEYPGSPYIIQVEQKLALAEIGDFEVVPAPEPEPEPEPVAIPKPTLGGGKVGEKAAAKSDAPKPPVVKAKGVQSTDPAGKKAAAPKGNGKAKGEKAKAKPKEKAKAPKAEKPAVKKPVEPVEKPAAPRPAE